MARPKSNKPEKDRKDKHLTIRISPEQHRLIKQTASFYGLRISEFALKCVLFLCKDKTKKMPDLDHELEKLKE